MNFLYLNIRFLILTALIFIFYQSSNAQNAFSKTYSSSLSGTYLSCIAESPDHFIFIGGGSAYNSSGCLLIKLSPEGDTIWARIFGQGSQCVPPDAIEKIVATNDSGCVSLTQLNYSYYPNEKIQLDKFDKDGNEIWTIGIDTNLNPLHAIGLFKTDDDNLIVWTEIAPLNPRCVTIHKFDKLGHLLYEHSIQYDTLTAYEGKVKMFNDKTFLFTFYSNQGTDSIWFLKTDSLGIPLWSRKFKRGNMNWRFDLLPDGRIITFQDISITTNFMILNSLGIPILNKTIDSIFITGNSINPDSTMNLYGMNRDGMMCYFKTNFDLSNLFAAQSLPVNNYLNSESNWMTSPGSQIYLYPMDEDNIPDSSFCLTRFDSAFNAPCAQPIMFYTDTFSLNLQPDTVPTNMLRDTAIAFHYFSITNIPAEFFLDRVVDLCASTNLKEEQKQIIKLYPNPFHASATFSSEKNNSRLELKIYNILGVAVRDDQILNITSYILHRGSLPDGLYFYELRTPNSELLGNGKFIIE